MIIAKNWKNISSTLKQPNPPIQLVETLEEKVTRIEEKLDKIAEVILPAEGG